MLGYIVSGEGVISDSLLHESAVSDCLPASND